MLIQNARSSQSINSLGYVSFHNIIVLLMEKTNTQSATMCKHNNITYVTDSTKTGLIAYRQVLRNDAFNSNKSLLLKVPSFQISRK